VSIETPIEFELEQYKDRVDAMQMANELLREERDRLKDAADSLHTELELSKQTLKQAESVISRLRTHIAQGVEL
jgi:predicted nuclease with TOPRIM domain